MHLIRETVELPRSTFTQLVQLQTDKITSLEQELKAAKAENDSQTSSAHEEVERLKRENTNILATLDRNHAQLTVALNNSVEFQSRLAELHAAHAELQQQCDKATDSERELSARLHEIRERNANLDIENEDLKTKNEELNIQAISLRALNTQLQQELNDLRTSHDKLNVEYGVLHSFTKGHLHTLEKRLSGGSETATSTEAHCATPALPNQSKSKEQSGNESGVLVEEPMPSPEKPDDNQVDRDQWSDLRSALCPLLRDSLWAPQNTVSKAQDVVGLFRDLQAKHRADAYVEMTKIIVDEATADDDTKRAKAIARLCHEVASRMTLDVFIDAERYKNENGKFVAGGLLFRKLLLNIVQSRFEASNTPPGIGLNRFIGWLFRLKLLSVRIIHACIRGMLAEGLNLPGMRERALNGVVALFDVVGKTIDTPLADAHMSVYFLRLRESMSDQRLSEKTRSNIQRILKLRANGWDITKTLY